MSTAVMPTQLDIGETTFQSRRNSSSACRVYEAGGYGGGDRREWQMHACTTTTTFYAAAIASRHRNLSGPCTTGTTGTPRPTLDNRALATPPPGVPGAAPRGERGGDNNKDHHQPRPTATTTTTTTTTRDGSNGGRHGSVSSHRKLDRSLSDSEDRLNGNGRGVNSSRYKTELCRPFEESGHCKYGDKCQFAHGANELRNLTRHPKYKTERCRTYHTIGFCPYGPRCHFIHNEDEHVMHQRKNVNVNNAANSARLSSSSSSSAQKPCQFILPPSSSTATPSSSLLAQRPSNLCGLNSLGSSFESVSSSSSPGNLSPSHLDDTFPPIGTFSPSAVTDGPSSRTEAGQDSEPPTGTFFNFPASDAASLGSIMTPLNIQTQQMYNNMLDMAALARFSAVLNISQNQQNNQTFSANLNVCQQSRQQQQQPDTSSSSSSSATESCWTTGPDMGVAFPPPSTSPHSAHSDDSMGSNGSLELSAASSGLDNATHLVNSPHDLGRSMRLPIFNKFSSESES